MPKLSVIVPVYNTEKYLRECIDSILTQTFKDFELILVDDGSTDGSGTICDEYAKMDERIRVIHQENSGVTRARKNGAAISAGEYVTCVDSDDWIDPDTYCDMMLQITNHHADMGIFAIIEEKKLEEVVTNRIGVGYYSKEKLRNTVYPRMLFDYSINASGAIASLCNKITRRNILVDAMNIIPDSLDYGEDAIAGYLCMLNASGIYVCNEPYYHYRDNLSSASHAKSSIMAERILTLDREMRRHFSCYDTDMAKQIDGHIVRHTVEMVRSILIYSTEEPLSERSRTARDFCELAQITSAIEKAYPKICDKKEKIKVMLIRYKMFGVLYFLFRKV